MRVAMIFYPRSALAKSAVLLLWMTNEYVILVCLLKTVYIAPGPKAKDRGERINAQNG